MRILVFEEKSAVTQEGAKMVARAILQNPKIVLGLATGSTPLDLYKQLINYYREDLISFREASSFNLDEYVGLDPNHPQSYAHYMKTNLFDHVDFSAGATQIPKGFSSDLAEECLRYESAMEAKGGVDLQILGIGRNGHIGFNEPGTAFDSVTHVVELDEGTCQDNARFFEKREDVPGFAISMGIKSILQAKEIILLALGKEKAQAVAGTVQGVVTPQMPASILQLHPKVTIIADKEAASSLEKRRYELVSKEKGRH